MGRTFAIGDVHGCARELEKLLKKIDPHKSDRIIQVGDLINKGPDSHGAISLARAYDMETVMGNHELRMLTAKKAKSSKSLSNYNKDTYQQLTSADWKYLKMLPKFIYENTLNTVFVHGGFCPKPSWHSQSLDFVTTVQVITKKGLPEKRSSYPHLNLWTQYWKRDPFVIYGHTPRKTVYKTKKTLCLDTGCVYGGRLTAYCVEEKRLISVKAKHAYC